MKKLFLFLFLLINFNLFSDYSVEEKEDKIRVDVHLDTSVSYSINHFLNLYSLNYLKKFKAIEFFYDGKKVLELKKSEVIYYSKLSTIEASEFIMYKLFDGSSNNINKNQFLLKQKKQ